MVAINKSYFVICDFDSVREAIAGTRPCEIYFEESRYLHNNTQLIDKHRNVYKSFIKGNNYREFDFALYDFASILSCDFDIELSYEEHKDIYGYKGMACVILL